MVVFRPTSFGSSPDAKIFLRKRSLQLFLHRIPPDHRSKKGVGHHEIRLRVDGYALIRDGSSCAAGDRAESVDSPQLHNGTKLVSNHFEAVPARADQAPGNGEFAAAA